MDINFLSSTDTDSRDSNEMCLSVSSRDSVSCDQSHE